MLIDYFVYLCLILSLTEKVSTYVQVSPTNRQCYYLSRSSDFPSPSRDFVGSCSELDACYNDLQNDDYWQKERCDQKFFRSMISECTDPYSSTQKMYGCVKSAIFYFDNIVKKASQNKTIVDLNGRITDITDDIDDEMFNVCVNFKNIGNTSKDFKLELLDEYSLALGSKFTGHQINVSDTDNLCVTTSQKFATKNYTVKLQSDEFFGGESTSDMYSRASKEADAEDVHHDGQITKVQSKFPLDGPHSGDLEVCVNFKNIGSVATQFQVKLVVDFGREIEGTNVTSDKVDIGNTEQLCLYTDYDFDGFFRKEDRYSVKLLVYPNPREVASSIGALPEKKPQPDGKILQVTPSRGDEYYQACVSFKNTGELTTKFKIELITSHSDLQNSTTEVASKGDTANVCLRKGGIKDWSKQPTEFTIKLKTDAYEVADQKKGVIPDLQRDGRILQVTPSRGDQYYQACVNFKNTGDITTKFRVEMIYSYNVQSYTTKVVPKGNSANVCLRKDGAEDWRTWESNTQITVNLMTERPDAAGWQRDISMGYNRVDTKTFVIPGLNRDGEIIQVTTSKGSQYIQSCVTFKNTGDLTTEFRVELMEGDGWPMVNYATKNVSKGATTNVCVRKDGMSSWDWRGWWGEYSVRLMTEDPTAPEWQKGDSRAYDEVDIETRPLP